MSFQEIFLQEILSEIASLVNNHNVVKYKFAPKTVLTSSLKQFPSCSCTYTMSLTLICTTNIVHMYIHSINNNELSLDYNLAVFTLLKNLTRIND